MTGNPSRPAAMPSDSVSAERTEFLRALSLRLRTPLVHFFERRVGHVAEAEDLAQEVFERLARHKDLDRLDQLDGYVFTVATNLLRDRARKRIAQAADSHVSLDQVADFSEEITPERVLLGKDAVNRFLAALADLPERTRTVLMLRRYEGLEFKEIARRLGISVSAVEKHVLRAMDYLSRRLDLE
jgi:RNA polymerase sigma-70 factor (ECF subfamily)